MQVSQSKILYLEEQLSPTAYMSKSAWQNHGVLRTFVTEQGIQTFIHLLQQLTSSFSVLHAKFWKLRNEFQGEKALKKLANDVFFPIFSCTQYHF